MGRRLLTAIIVALAFLAPAAAQDRVALLIGNGDYERSDWDLDAQVGGGYVPVNNVERLAAVLRRFDYDVEVVTNATKPEIDAAVTAFGDRIAAAGPGDVQSMFFYSGHAFRFGDNNYLAPRDLDASYIEQAVGRSFALYDVAAELRRRGASRDGRVIAHVMLVDACQDDFRLPSRDNRLMSTNTTTGVAREEYGGPGDAALRVLVGFSTQAGEPASAGTGPLSPYTEVLAEALADHDGRPIDDILSSVADRVRRNTRRSPFPQRPYHIDNLNIEGGLYLGEHPRVKARRLFQHAGMPMADAADFDRAVAQFREHADLTGPIDRTFVIALRLEVNSNRFPPGAPPATPTPTPTPTATPTPTPTPAPPPSSLPDARELAATERAPVLEEGERLDDFSAFRDCAECPDMVVLPSGAFVMGSPSGESGRFDNEGPRRTVTIGYRLAVGRFEVTWEEWDACVRAGGCDQGPVDDAGGDHDWGRGRQPAIEMSWNDARDYARWLSSTTNVGYRLLSEAEWEYAARAGREGRFSWGDADPTCSETAANGANFRACSDDRTRPVGSFAANRWGLYDVHGNAREWVQDCWNESYRGAPSDGAVWSRGDCDYRVLRGGSWLYIPGWLRAAKRDRNVPTERDVSFGFRLARPVSP